MTLELFEKYLYFIFFLNFKKKGTIMFRKFISLILISFISASIYSATFTVTNNNDDMSVGSIRWALGQSMSNNDSDTIIFADNFTINLTGNNRLFVLDNEGITIDARDKEIIIDGLQQTGSDAWPSVGFWLVDTGLLWGGGKLGGNATIKGIRMRNFKYGAILISGGSNNNVIENCTLYQNGTNGVKIDGTDKSKDGSSEVGNNIVRHCELHDNGNNGIFILNSDSDEVEDCIAYSNTQNGILVSMANGTVIRDCASYSNTQSGIWLISEVNNARIGNSFVGTKTGPESSGNGWPGIIISGDCNDNLIEGCYINNNKAEGIKIDDKCFNNHLNENKIMSNTNSGILITGKSGSNLITNNVIGKNDQSGIWITDESCDNRIHRNTIGKDVNGESGGNGWAGVIISGGSLDNYVGGDTSELGNLIVNNTAEGVKVDEINTKRNLVRFNTYFNNKNGGFIVYNGANEGLPVPYLFPPTYYSQAGDVTVYGMTFPSHTVDIYVSDSETDKTQARYYAGTVQSDNEGKFSLKFNYANPLKLITAVAHDSIRNSSGFGTSLNSVGLTGKIIDSDNSEPVYDAEVFIYDAQSRFYAGTRTGTDGKFSFYLKNGSYYIVVKKEGFIFPSQSASNSSSAAKGEMFQISAFTDLTIPIDSGYPLKVSIENSPDTLRAGDPMKLRVKIKNNSNSDYNDVKIKTSLPKSLKASNQNYIVKKNEISANNPVSKSKAMSVSSGTVESEIQGSGSDDGIVLSVSSLNKGEEINVDKVFTLSGGSESDELTLGARVYIEHGPNNYYLSPLKTKRIEIQNDDLIENATLIGKVFTDKNANGIQDNKEQGIGNISLITEEGIIITTDKHGRYSIPTLKEGSHVISIMKDSLPQGLSVNEKSQIVNIRNGSMHKVNFALSGDSVDSTPSDEKGFILNLKENISVAVPETQVFVEKIQNEYISKTDDGKYKINFKVYSNCLAYIKDVKFIIRKAATHSEIYSKDFNTLEFFGNIPFEFDNKLIREINGESVEYFLDISLENGSRIQTSIQRLKIFHKGFLKSPVLESVEFRDDSNTAQNYGIPKQSAINAHGKAIPDTEFRIVCSKNGEKVFSQALYTDVEGVFDYNFLVPAGDYKIELAQSGEDGNYAVLNEKNLSVKDNYFIFVGMGEAELGKFKNSGAIEIAGKGDKYNEEFYSESEAAFYLKGKIKGKYLITMSYDSRKKDNEFSKYIDPDKYYPIYGDFSEINYDGNSKGKFYFLLEWDRSDIKVGNFQETFSENSLIYYSRMIYGAEMNLQSLTLTPYGDNKYKFKLFAASPESIHAFDRLEATGGSVYYLRHRTLIPGSEKVFVEIRDKINGMVVSSLEQTRDVNYEIDYDAGRIVFNSPVSRIYASNFITEENYSSGYQVSVVTEYDYEPDSIVHKNSFGARVEKDISERVVIGGTFINEENAGEADGTLNGVDVKVNISEKNSLKLAMASSDKNEKTVNKTLNGGINYVTSDVQEKKSGEAYSAEWKSDGNKWGSAKVYHLNMKPGFENEREEAELGSNKSGAEIVLFPDKRASVYSDVFFENVDESFIATKNYENKKEGRIGILYKLTEDLKLETEYHLIDKENISGAVEDEVTDLYGAGLFWDVNEKLNTFVKQQLSQGDRNLDTTGIGFNYQVFDKWNFGAAQNFGEEGDYTSINSVISISDTDEIYLSARNSDFSRISGNSSDFVVGLNRLIDRNSSFFTEYKYENSTDKHLTSTSGYRKRINNFTNISLSYENDKNDLTDSSNRTTAAGISYNKPEKLLMVTSLEVSEFDSTYDLEQLLTKNKIKYYFENGLSLFSRATYSYTRNAEVDSNIAYFKEYGFGSAYRPVYFDKVNMLLKYTHLQDKNPVYDNDEINLNEKASIVSGEVLWDVIKNIQYFIKYAYREKTFSGFDDENDNDLVSKVNLWINRVNLYFTKTIGTALEYRIKEFENTDEEKKGYLTEVFYDPFENIRLTIGYNFTDFSDNLETLNDYDSGGAYLRLTGKAFFDDLKFQAPFKEEFYEWQPFKSISDSLTITQSLDLCAGYVDGSFEYNKSNVHDFEKDYRYIYGEDKENTYNTAIYNRYSALIEYPLNDIFSFNSEITLDPNTFIAKSKTVNVTSANGDSAYFTYYYYPSNDTTVPLSVRTKYGNSFLTGSQDVHDYKVNSQTIATNWGDSFFVPETELEENYLPFTELSTKYKNDETYFKLNLLGSADSAYSSDDPLYLSGRRSFWQPHPWQYFYNPGTYYYGGMQAFEKGRIDDSLTYYNRNSNAEFITMLRGFEFASYIENLGRIEGAIASPITQWDVYDEYTNPNNISGALRYKSAVSEEVSNIQTGLIYTFRTGFYDEKQDFLNQVYAGDLYFTTLLDTNVTAQFAQSETDLDKTSRYSDTIDGSAFKVMLDKKIQLYDWDNTIVLDFTAMQKNFFAGTSDYRYTSVDQYWSRHISFYDTNERFKKEVETFRLGDGIRENRDVIRFKNVTQIEDVMLNEFGYMYVTGNDEKDFLESRIRDEFMVKLIDSVELRLMALNYKYPDTTNGIDPLLGSTLNVSKDLVPGGSENEILNDTITEGKDASLNSYSSGLKWTVVEWLELAGIYEYTNNWGDQFPQDIITDTSFGNVNLVDGIRYDDPEVFLYSQDVFELPAYSYYDIYKLKAFIYPVEHTALELSWSKNENKFASGIDDNINHIFVQLKYEPEDKKYLARINYTHSKTMDVADYIENNELNYESHDNYFGEFRYKLTDNSMIYANYGIFAGMTEDPVSPFIVVPWALPVLDTRDIFKIVYSRKF